MVTDPIADLLIRITNAQKVGHLSVKAPYSRMKFEVAKILEKENFVNGVSKDGKKPKEFIVINLKYENEAPAISHLKRISKPGQRVYLGKEDIKQVKHGHGVSIISTSKGLMSNKDAKKNNMGGELLCEVW